MASIINGKNFSTIKQNTHSTAIKMDEPNDFNFSGSNSTMTPNGKDNTPQLPMKMIKARLHRGMYEIHGVALVSAGLNSEYAPNTLMPRATPIDDNTKRN